MAQATFTIKRSELRQGGWIGNPNSRGKGYTSMRNDSGLMCCLGAIGLACGIHPNHLIGHDMPSNVLAANPTYADLPNIDFFVYDNDGTFEDTSLSNDAASINDEPTFTHEEREEKLIARFAVDDIELIIID